MSSETATSHGAHTTHTHGGHHHSPEELRSLVELEGLRDSDKNKAKADYGDANIYLSEKEFNDDSLRPMFETKPGYFIFVIALASVMAVGVAAFVRQMVVGMGVTGLHQPVFWGAYIATFVFWVGLSHSGTIVSSILRLTMANWRRPILRGAEAMTAFSLMVAGLFPMIHVGRQWRVYYMFPLPNQRELWPNFKSPLMWDMMAISIYLTGSLTFLYIGLLPDIATARDRAIANGNWRAGYLKLLALGWRGRNFDWAVYNKASLFLAVIILCIAPSVHTIVSWDFAMTMTPGWHTTIFGPYFVVGAINSGVAGVILLMIIIRSIFKLQHIIRDLHIDCLGQLQLVIALIWLYFYFCEFNVTWYSNKPEEMAVWNWQWERFPLQLIVMIAGTALAVGLLGFKKIRRNMKAMVAITILINIGMYCERYLIVVPVLSHRDNPYKWTDYWASPTELSIILMSFCFFALLYALFIKVFPIITMADVKEGVVISGDVRLGKHAVRVQVKE